MNIESKDPSIRANYADCRKTLQLYQVPTDLDELKTDGTKVQNDMQKTGSDYTRWANKVQAYYYEGLDSKIWTENPEIQIHICIENSAVTLFYYKYPV